MYYCGDQTGDYILGNGLLLTDCKYVLQDGLQDAISALDQLQNLDIEKFVFQCLDGDIPLSQPKATVINYGNYTNVFLSGFMTGGEFSRISRDGNYATIEKWAANGNKICRYELRNARPHGRSTEWDPETGDIISDEYYKDGHRIDIHCNRIY